MFGKKNQEVIFRAVKFEICPDQEQAKVLTRISDICRRVWNQALAERNEIFNTYMKYKYKAIRIAEEDGDNKRAEELREQLKQAYEKHPLPTYIDQQNALTARIPQEPELQLVLRSWHEQTLVELHGVIKSFLALRKKGDPDARPPRMKDEGFFCDISGRFGFKVDLQSGTIQLSTERVGGENLVFPIPMTKRVKGKLKPSHQAELLGQAVKIKDFTIYRDERDLSKSGRFWVSVAFTVPRPETTEFVPENAVFVALGATRIGVVFPSWTEEAVISEHLNLHVHPITVPLAGKKRKKRNRQSWRQRQNREFTRQLPKGEMEIPLGRPDMHWQPKIEAVKARMVQVQKGSRKWNCLNNAKRKMETVKSHQQKQNRREVVQKLLRLGNHFVITDLVVRSKPGKLADASKPERGGVLGLNWSAQNTGAIGELVAWLEVKAPERGGTVQRHPAPSRHALRGEPRDKIQAARLLRESFLAGKHKEAG